MTDVSLGGFTYEEFQSWESSAPWRRPTDAEVAKMIDELIFRRALMAPLERDD